MRSASNLCRKSENKVHSKFQYRSMALVSNFIVMFIVKFIVNLKGMTFVSSKAKIFRFSVMIEKDKRGILRLLP